MGTFIYLAGYYNPGSAGFRANDNLRCTLQGTTGLLMDTRGGCFRNDCSKLTTRLWPELQDLVPSRLVVVPL